MNAPALEVRDLRKSFGPTQALKGVSFAARQGEVHALLGGNGSGKSTLIKILAGVHHADSGEVAIGGRSQSATSITPAVARELGLRFVHQQTSTFADLTVAENLFLGHGFNTTVGWRIPWRSVRAKAATLLDRFDIVAKPDALLRELNPATQTMVAIARALQDQEGAHQGILVLDEPTASLPAHEVDLLLQALRRYATAGQTILYVTHRLQEVWSVADMVTVLRDGTHAATVPLSGLDHDRLVELIMGRKVDRLIARAPHPSSGEPVVELSNVACGPLRDIDLRIGAGEIVGIAGLLGSGRSTIMRLLFGLQQPAAGSIRFDGRALQVDRPRAAMREGIAYVPEDRARDASFAALELLENISMPSLDLYYRRGWFRHRDERRDTRKLVESHLVKASSVRSSMSSLSGGNQQKVVLARWLRRKPRLLLLDEPSQGVDVGARLEIWELVRRSAAAGSAVLVVTSDFEELAGVCDRVVVLKNGSIVAEVTGSDINEAYLEHLTLEAI
jgi:ribose transport system ATP-binding protein